jgi:hypothetical protein
MKTIKLLKKTLISLVVLGTSSIAIADIAQDHFVMRVRFDGTNWQIIEQPRLIHCGRVFSQDTLTADNFRVEVSWKLDALSLPVKLGEVRIPNPRSALGEQGAVTLNNVVTDIFIPAMPGASTLPTQPGITSLKFRNLQTSLEVDVDMPNVEPIVDVPANNCSSPQYALRPLPTEAAPGEVTP